MNTEQENIINNWKLDDWSLPMEAFKYIFTHLDNNKTILEFGCGESTNILRKFYNVISIEESKQFSSKYKTNYCPLTNNWYNLDDVKFALKDKNYDFIIVDGPCKAPRKTIIEHLDILNTNVPIMFDDIMVTEHLNTMTTVAKILNKDTEVFQCKKNKKSVMWHDGKQFGVII